MRPLLNTHVPLKFCGQETGGIDNWHFGKYLEASIAIARGNGNLVIDENSLAVSRPTLDDPGVTWHAGSRVSGIGRRIDSYQSNVPAFLEWRKSVAPWAIAVIGKGAIQISDGLVRGESQLQRSGGSVARRICNESYFHHQRVYAC